MNFGNLEGLVNGTEQVVYDYEVTGSAVSSISTGNILNGDEDGWYTIIIRGVQTSTNTTNVLRFNGDSGTNYGGRGISADNTTIADSGTGNTGFNIFGVLSTKSFSILRVYAKSGSVRLVNILRADGISGTTVSTLYSSGYVWNNTSDNLVSMSLNSLSGSAIDVGTRIIILKSNNFTNGTPTGVITTPYIKGSWVRVKSETLDSALQTKTITGLDGNRDVIYRIVVDAYANTSGLSNALTIQFNSDSGNNYGNQRIYALSTTIAADRSVYSSNPVLIISSTTGIRGSGEILLFAQSGFIRPAVQSEVDAVEGTTVFGITMTGQSWNNTSDNITSLTIASNRASGIGIGTRIDVYALRPNG